MVRAMDRHITIKDQIMVLAMDRHITIKDQIMVLDGLIKMLVNGRQINQVIITTLVIVAIDKEDVIHANKDDLEDLVTKF